MRAKTAAGSISAEEVGGLHADTLAYIANMEQSAEAIGIRKTYASTAIMQADTNPTDSLGKALRYGQLVIIYNEEDTTSGDNGDIYAYQNPGWLKVGNVTADAKINVKTISIDDIDSLNEPHTSTGAYYVYSSKTAKYTQVVGFLIVQTDWGFHQVTQHFFSNYKMDQGGSAHVDNEATYYKRHYGVSTSLIKVGEWTAWENAIMANAELKTALAALSTSIASVAADLGTITTDISTINTALNTVKASITQEIADRKAADKTLQTSIDAEKTARTSADSNLTASMKTEAATRKAADDTLQANIDKINNKVGAKDGIATLNSAKKIAYDYLPRNATQQQDLRVSVRKAIPMYPRIGNYYFFDSGIRFRVDRKKILAGDQIVIPSDGYKYYYHRLQQPDVYLPADTVISSSNIDTLFPENADGTTYNVIVQESTTPVLVKITKDQQLHLDAYERHDLKEGQFSFKTKRKWITISQGQIVYDIPTPTPLIGHIKITDLKGIQIFRTVRARVRWFKDTQTPPFQKTDSEGYILGKDGVRLRRRFFCKTTADKVLDLTQKYPHVTVYIAYRRHRPHNEQRRYAYGPKLKVILGYTGYIRKMV